MDFNHFLRDRRPRWQRLSDLLDRVEARGLKSLAGPEADELFSLYRLTSSDLSLVQTRTGSLTVVDYLEGLVARAYAHLQVPHRARFFHSWWMILRHYFPDAVRRRRAFVAASALALIAGVVVAFVATYAAPSSAEAFLPDEHLKERPGVRVARLEQDERDGHRTIAGGSENTAFTVFLFNNNIRVSVLAFALGITFGVGTLVMLFYNGAMLGSLAALYLMDGQAKFFVAWVGPHGVIELPCVALAGAAGFMLAAIQLRRDRGPFRIQLRAQKPDLIDLLVGAATLLVLAGTIEGGFSQINEPTLPYVFKIAVAGVLAALLFAYLFLIPVRPRPIVSTIGDAGAENPVRSLAALASSGTR